MRGHGIVAAVFFAGACMVCCLLAAGLRLLGIPGGNPPSFVGASEIPFPIPSPPVCIALYFCVLSGGVTVYLVGEAWQARRLFFAAATERRQANAAMRAAARGAGKQLSIA
ncbi:hypothetical protein ABPG75_005843 [Micractinium tetrahymenae]